MASRPRRRAAPTFNDLMDDYEHVGLRVNVHAAGDVDHDEAFDSESETEDIVVAQENSDSDDADEIDVNRREKTQEQSSYFGRNDFEWKKSVPTPRGRRNRANILRQSEGPTTAAKHADQVSDCFHLFVTEEMLDLIVLHTNQFAEVTLRSGGWMLDRWIPIDRIELRAFIACLLFAGVSKSNHESCEQLWSSDFGRPFLRATMSLQRFTMIMKFLRFDNKETRPERKERDKMAPIRDLWEQFVQRCRMCYVPGPNCTIDEQVVGFRGRCPFRTYMPSKPDKYGIKVWWICDSGTSYAYNGQVYLGREGNLPEFGLASRVVLDLCRPMEQTGRNLTTDCFFTSVPLAQTLLTKGLTLLGTMKSNKAEIPAEFQKSRTRELHSSLHGFSDKLTLCSYVPKRGKSVILLSSMHCDNELSDNESKPQMILDYNKTKGSVDTLDQCVHAYSTSRGTKRWPNKLFFNIIDIAAFNGFIIFLKNKPNWNDGKLFRRRLYLLELAKQLAHDHMDRRAQNSKMSVSLRGTLRDLGFENRQIATHNTAHDTAVTCDRDQTRGRCHKCEHRTLVRVRCTQCEKFVCKDHSVKVVRCLDCQ